MRPIIYDIEELEQFLKTNVIATMADIKRVLGTKSNKTALRKMKQLSYLSSYSHSGSYYTMKNLVRFDNRGLWSYRGVYFSKLGTLMSTIEHFVNTSQDGYFPSELEELLGVGSKMALARLIANGAIAREKVRNRYLYCSADSTIGKQQIMTRRLMESAQQDLSDGARAAIVIFFSLLNEQERRLYAGVEAIKYGYGGDRFVANILGLHPKTVARGRREIMTGEVERDRVRKAGSGRTPVEKKAPRSSTKSKS
jgi:hypothetical protein